MKYKYLYIFEDYEMKVSNDEPTEADLINCGEVLDIVNLENHTRYLDGGWKPIEEFKN